MSTTPIPMPAPQTENPTGQAEYLRMLLAQQGNTQGMTQMGPSMQPVAPTQQQVQKPGAQQTSAFGVGERGAHQRESMQNLVKSAQGLAGTITQAVQAKQQRTFQVTLQRYMGSVQGLQQAQSQVQQGQKMIQDATAKLKQNPQDPQALQMVQQGKQLMQQGQQALQQNQTNLNDMANDPKAHKVIAKAFGIDDKNADSPERSALIDMLKKSTGLNQNAADLMSRMPQTQQLSPQAQAQQQMVQAGVVGKPATQGQILAADTKMATTQISEAGKDERALLADRIKATASGQVVGDDGKVRPMTAEEVKANPVVSARLATQQARQDLAAAQAQLAQARTTAMPEQLKLMEARVATLQANAMMRQKEFGIKVQEEERKQLETAAKIGDASLVNTPEGQSIDISKFTGGRPLQSWAQQTVVQTQDRLQQVKALEDKIKTLGLQDNNQPGYLATSRLGYAMGISSDEGSLAAEISNIELQRVVNAATILKGSSRAYAALSQAMVHTPNAWVDSPKMMLQKLQTIESNLNDMQTDAVQYGQKGERSNEMPTPATPKAKPTAADPLGILN
jgi:hypothetical protein